MFFEKKHLPRIVFELIPWSINFKNTFDGKNTSGYILYDHKTRSVKIPCFEVTTIAKFGDGIEGETIYYKDVNMKQRHVNYPIFHVEDMTKADSCESSVIPEPQKPPKKPTLTTTPTTTQDDTVEIEVNGKVGTTVFVNGVDSGKTIDSTGKVKVILDTSGDDGDKSFSISLKDDKGNESEALVIVIKKESHSQIKFGYCGLAKWVEHNTLVDKGFCKTYGENITSKKLEEINSNTGCSGYYKTYGYYNSSDKLVAVTISNGNCVAAMTKFHKNPPEPIEEHCKKYGGTGNYRWMYYWKIQPFGGYGTLGVNCEM